MKYTRFAYSENYPKINKVINLIGVESLES